MFMFEVLVEDKKLGDALRALVGIAAEVKPPRPVGNGVITKGKVAVTHDGTPLGMLLHLLKTKYVRQFNGPEAIKWFQAAGLSKSACYVALAKAVQTKAIGRHGKGNRTFYTVR